MSDYYTTLQVNPDVSAAEIKRAYFGLVRTYPPDLYPDQFMKIRNAYEVLIDPNTRREYDSYASLPSLVKLYYNEGRQAFELGDYAGAIKYLEEVLKTYKHFNVVNCILGDAYLKNGNSGKAIKIFEELVHREPQNAGFAGRLANSYELRGWHYKAIDQYIYALSLDEDNIGLWLGLIRSYLTAGCIYDAVETIKNGLEVSNQKGWDNLELYYQYVIVNIMTGDLESMHNNIEDLKRKALDDEDSKTNVAWFLASLSNMINNVGLGFIAVSTIDAATELLPDDPHIREIEKEIKDITGIVNQIKELRHDPFISELIFDMIKHEINGKSLFEEIENGEEIDEEELQHFEGMQFVLEFNLIAEIDAYRSDVFRLKKNYPELYELKKDFFNKVINRRKERKLFETYLKKHKIMQKTMPHVLDPDYEMDNLEEEENSIFDDSDEAPIEIAETYVRPSPKIGRNEPCPCNSGKKYKKCCGKN